MISRRHFLRIGARSAALIGGGASVLHLTRMQALAQAAPGYRALVCVFLTGGNDANNMVVPFSSSGYSAYADARGSLALPQGSLLPLATAGGDQFALHPQLQGLDGLFQQQRMAIVFNVGTLVRPLSRDEYQAHAAPVPRNLFSHIDQQLAWQTAADPDETSGWAGRAAERLATGSGAFPAVVSTAGTATFGRGVNTMHATIVPGTAPGLMGVDSSRASLARLQSFEQLLTLSSGSVLVGAANEATREGLRQANLLTAALSGAPALGTRFPATSLGSQLAEVAKVIGIRDELGASRQVFFCSLSGFDTHVGQLNAHASLMTELGSALVAFQTALAELGITDQVTTFTQSEFGRTLQPTSAIGSDHAWGSHHLVIGGAVRGGTVYGTFPTLDLGGPDDVTNRGVWLPTASLAQYGATLAAWLGVSTSDMPAVFPTIGNFTTGSLGFMMA
jgi:uncharacterized protein (DUF1501 family)